MKITGSPLLFVVAVLLVPTSAQAPNLDCNFDTDLCSWTQDSRDNKDWRRNKDTTISQDTGPKHDHTGGGSYIYLEASLAKLGDNAILLSPRVQVHSGGCLRFWYHMWGKDIGNLNVFAGQLVWNKLGNQYHSWKLATVDIPQGVHQQVKIEATRGNGPYGDIALDDITFTNNRSCSPSGAQAPNLDCNFNIDLCSWTQGSGGNTNWTRWKGNTGNSGGDSYIHPEASLGSSDVKAILLSPRLTVPSGGCLRFFYHVFGKGIGNLTIFAGPSSQLLWQKHGNQYHSLMPASVDIPQGVNQQVKIEATKSNGSTVDIALDDLTFANNGSCTPNSTGTSHSQRFDFATVVEGDSATLTCNVRKAAPNATVDFVESLTLSRKATSDRPPDFEGMVHYNVSRNYDKEKMWFVPWITEWTSKDRITLTLTGMFVNGSRLEENAETMRIVMTFNEVVCEDSAIYRCQARYQVANNHSKNDRVDTTLKVFGQVEEVMCQIKPDKRVYKEEDTVTIVCLTHGPGNVAIRWRYQNCPTAFVQNSSMRDLQPTSDVTEDNQEISESNGCAFIHFKSVLKNAKLSNRDRKICLIQCVAGTVGQNGGSFVGHQQWSKTIDYVDPDPIGFYIALNWNLIVTLCAIGALLISGTVVGIYGRFKDTKRDGPEESHQIGQMHESEVANTVVETPALTEEHMELDVTARATDPVIEDLGLDKSHDTLV